MSPFPGQRTLARAAALLVPFAGLALAPSAHAADAGVTTISQVVTAFNGSATTWVDIKDGINHLDFSARLKDPDGVASVGVVMWKDGATPTSGYSEPATRQSGTATDGIWGMSFDAGSSHQNSLTPGLYHVAFEYAIDSKSNMTTLNATADVYLVGSSVLAAGTPSYTYTPSSETSPWGSAITAVPGANVVPTTSTYTVEWYARNTAAESTEVLLSGANSTTYTPSNSMIGWRVFPRFVWSSTGRGQLAQYGRAWTVTQKPASVATATIIDQTSRTWQVPTTGTANVKLTADGTAIVAGTTYTASGPKVVTISASLTNATDYVWATGQAPADQTLDFRTLLTPAVPTSDRTQLRYTIPSTAGVEYLVNGTPTTAGSYTGSGTVTVTARVTAAASTRIAAGTPSSWTFDLSTVAVTPTAPTADQAAGSYTLPTTTGVTYLVDGVPTTAGTRSSRAQVRITAIAAAPLYQLTGTTSWTFDLRRQVTAPAPTADLDTMTYTVPEADGITWLVNGVPTPAGTYPGSGTLTVTATATDSESTVLTGDRSWTLRLDVTQVSAAAPTVDLTAGTLTVPDTAGVTYLVDGSARAAGTYPFTTEVAVTAEAAGPQYQLTGTSTWTFDLRRQITAQSPSADLDTMTYTLPEVAGVVWQVNGQDVAAGSFPGSGTLTITARVVEPTTTVLTGEHSWTLRLTATKVTAKAPTGNRTTGKLTIPAVTGVQYRVNGTVRKAGTYAYATQVKVTAQAVSQRYTLAGTTSWTVDLRPAKIAVRAPKPTFNQRTGVLKLAKVTGVKWTVNGKVTQGGATVTVKKGKKAVVKATATAKYTLTGTKSWTFKRSA